MSSKGRSRTRRLLEQRTIAEVTLAGCKLVASNFGYDLVMPDGTVLRLSRPNRYAAAVKARELLQQGPDAWREEHERQKRTLQETISNLQRQMRKSMEHIYGSPYNPYAGNHDRGQADKA